MEPLVFWAKGRKESSLNFDDAVIECQEAGTNSPRANSKSKITKIKRCFDDSFVFSLQMLLIKCFLVRALLLIASIRINTYIKAELRFNAFRPGAAGARIFLMEILFDPKEYKIKTPDAIYLKLRAFKLNENSLFSPRVNSVSFLGKLGKFFFNYTNCNTSNKRQLVERNL